MNEKIEIKSTFNKRDNKITISFLSEELHFHCNDKEDFAYDFYWNLAKIERQKILVIDENFIIENFLTQLEIKGLEEHEVLHRENQKKRQIKAKIANLIAAALAYRINIRIPKFQECCADIFQFFEQLLKRWNSKWESKPEAKKLQRLLFSIELAESQFKDFRSDLDNSTIPEGLKQELKNNKISLSQNATISIEERGSRWLINDKNKMYGVREEKEEDKHKLNIYLWCFARRAFEWIKKRYMRWQNKMTAKGIQEYLAGKSNEILKKISEIRLTAFEDITFTDQKVIFTFDKEKNDAADFHQESDYFLLDFLFVYNLDPERIQNIIEDLWKVLVNEQYTRIHRYTLATNFINAFNLKDSHLLREKNQYEYLRWHKERYKIALELYDEEKIKESARAWVNLLADEEEHAFIDQYCDREEEMANVIFGAPSNEEPSKATDYLYELEKDKKALQSLSAWFLRRYCIGTGIRIIWRIVWWKIIKQDNKLMKCILPYLSLFLFFLLMGVGLSWLRLMAVSLNNLIIVIAVSLVIPLAVLVISRDRVKRLIQRWAQSNHKSDGIILYERICFILLLLCPILYFIIFWVSRSIPIIVFLDLAFIFLFLTSCLLGLFLKVNIFRLFLPRVLMGVIVGWLGFLATEELWKYTVFLDGVPVFLVGIPLMFIVWLYIFTEINNKIVKKGGGALSRSLSIFLIGLFESLIVGMLACSLMGRTMIENSGILAKENIYVLYDRQDERFKHSPTEMWNDDNYIYKYEVLQFRIDSKFQRDLDNKNISGKLRQEFENNGILLSHNATVSSEEKDNMWMITDKENTYIVRKMEDKLNIYDKIKHEFKIDVLGYISFMKGLRLLYKQKWRLGEFQIYPSILFIRSIFALFVGVILQLIWQDKPMTEPL